jgi:hypothetical protein
MKCLSAEDGRSIAAGGYSLGERSPVNQARERERPLKRIKMKRCSAVSQLALVQLSSSPRRGPGNGTESLSTLLAPFRSEPRR